MNYWIWHDLDSNSLQRATRAPSEKLRATKTTKTCRQIKTKDYIFSEKGRSKFRIFINSKIDILDLHHNSRMKLDFGKNEEGEKTKYAAICTVLSEKNLMATNYIMFFKNQKGFSKIKNVFQKSKMFFKN